MLFLGLSSSTGSPTILTYLKAAPDLPLPHFLKLIENHLALVPSTTAVEMGRFNDSSDQIKAAARRLHLRHSEVWKSR